MLNIIITHDTAGHRLSTELEGQTARLDYELEGKDMSITHTHVPGPIEGRGVAAELMSRALEVAAANGWTVRPVCSYAVAYMKRHAASGTGGTSAHTEALLDEALEESFPASDSPSVGGAN